MLVSCDVFDEVGGFDTAFARDFNDVDFCLRVGERGFRVAWTPYAHFVHHEGVSIVRRAPDPGELALFKSRWSEALAADPFYSPALHPTIERLYEPL
jgi:GT2 family glycosyltransferase